MAARRILLAALLALAAACAGDEPLPRSGGKPPTVTLIANGVVLNQGRDAPTIFGVDAAGSTISIIVNHGNRASIDAYLLEEPTSPVPSKECETTAGVRRDLTCVRSIASGVRETLEWRGDVKAIALVLREGPGRVDLRFDYDEGSRNVSMRLPALAPPPRASACRDNGCNPYLEIMPLRGGSLTATATFTGGPARLQVQQGRVIGKAFSGTGIPYRIPAEDPGSSGLRVSTRLDAPGEYALAFMNENPSAAITGIVIEARWP